MYDVESSHSQMYMCFIQRCHLLAKSQFSTHLTQEYFLYTADYPDTPIPPSETLQTQIMKPVPSVSLSPLHCAVSGVLTPLFFFTH